MSKNNQELFNERISLIARAVALQPVERVPVVINDDMYAVTYTGVPMHEYATDIKVSNKAMIDTCVGLGSDGIQNAFMLPEMLSLQWMNKVSLPGRELPKNAPWQIHEVELMTVDDYDVILQKGWNSFYQDYIQNRFDNLMARLGPQFGSIPTAYQNVVAAGIVPISGGVLASAFEMICGARSMNKFMIDMFRIPDKIQAVLDEATPVFIAGAKAQLAGKPFGIWVGGWRGASAFMNHKLWTRFVWPYMRQLAELAIEAGVTPIFHIDGNWERELEAFKDLPKGKCIIFPDGQTNIYKIKEVLGDHMCINGDVPAGLLSVGTPEEVYNYSSKLIQEIGPTGFILGPGCTIPMGTKVENAKAMVAAAH